VTRGRSGIASIASRFAAVGVATSLLYLLAGYALVEFAGIAPLWATSLAFVLVITVNYVSHYHWTFGSTVGHRVAIARFVVASAGGLILNMLLVDILTSKLGFASSASQLAVIVVVTAWNFCLNFLWVFASRRTSGARDTAD
jgi:putative flippase GtrA